MKIQSIELTNQNHVYESETLWFDQLDSFSQVKIILIPDQEFLPSVVDYIKQSLELRK
jgi:hypothetical protein